MVRWMDQRRTVCPHDCPDTCSVVATVEGGRVTACDGDPAHPFTRGFLCHKVAAYDRRIYSPDRILRPLVRRHKGAALEPASWDEALEIVAARLGQGESVLPYSYGGNMGLVARHAGHPFFHALGACRLQRTICDDAADAAWKSMVGRTVGTDPERAAESDYIVIWGMNASVVNIHLMPFVRDAQRRRAARLIVVDPYRNETAKMADEHVVVRPGTDAALALGMARAIVDEGLADLDYVASRTEGFERFRERLLRDYSVERCEAICGARGIRELARGLARARAPFLRLGIGFSRHANGGQAVRAVTSLAALVGAFRRGGAVFETGDAFEFDFDVLRRPDLAPRPTREVNMVRLGEALTADDRIRGLFVYQCNPAAVCPDQTAVRRGLARPDLFVVVHEQMMTDTCAFADVVLPASTSFETTDLYRSYGHYYLQLARPVIPPVGESRSNVALFNALAKRMGLRRDPIFDASEEERVEMLLSTRAGALAGIDLEALRLGEPVRIGVSRGDPFEAGFPTPSGRFRFADDGLPDPLPGYAPCPEGCESALRARYPLQLLAPPAKHFLNSTFGCVASLVARQKRPAVMLHPVEARSRGLRDGAPARVFNDRGETRAFAIVTEDVPEGVAVMPSVWWGRDVPGGGGVAANALTSQRLSDLGESSTFHCALVEVRPA
jgi:anaerobic selenocysteine-containing dehydrogenase